ncbi:MAG: peptidoglycan-associated lipoprotein Pal [Pseudomonadota bacterium]
MKLKSGGFIVLALMVVLSGCSSKGDVKDGDVSIEDKGSGADGALSSGAAGGSEFSGYSLDDPNSPLSRRVIYFEYDSAEITDADQELLTQHSGFLAANPGQQITLEGNTDERGSREYNIGLGDQRALSVQRIMELNGVSPGQITVVSYGEEKPAAEGHSEAAWRLNRRVELVY